MNENLNQNLLLASRWKRTLFFKLWNEIARDEELDASLSLQEKARKILAQLGELPSYRLSAPFRFISFLHPEYPKALLELSQPPLGLYQWGRDIKVGLKMGVVGSRKPTPYALRMAHQLTGIWAKLGFTIVSGGAIGVDGEAHRAALEVGGTTLVVLGGGFHHLHPRSHESLFRQILKVGGTLISEYPPEFDPRPYYFPERNRIIAGLSTHLFLAQAHAKSGSLSTARAALDLGREVFALRPIPGDLNFEGSEQLIEAGAPSIIEAAEIFRNLPSEPENRSPDISHPNGLS